MKTRLAGANHQDGARWQVRVQPWAYKGAAWEVAASHSRAVVCAYGGPVRQGFLGWEWM